MTVGYHWSPATRHESIRRRGLLVDAQPCVNGAEDDHHNAWVSLSPTPGEAWWLSGQALECGGFPTEHPVWDLWQVDLTDVEHTSCADGCPEMRAHQNIPPGRVIWIGSRKFGAETT